MTDVIHQGLVRFVPKQDLSKILIGEPVENIDVGLALYSGKSVLARVYSGSSVLSPGTDTGTKEEIGRVLSPVTQKEAGTIRCIGLNVRSSLDIQNRLRLNLVIV
jgi:hypothetical protein